MIMTKEIKPIDKLKTILCEVEEIEDNLTDLYSIGTKLYFEGDNTHIVNGNEEYHYGKEFGDYGVRLRDQDFNGVILDIETPIQERHLRMYCESKCMYMFITVTGMISVIENDQTITNTGIKLDNTKDFQNQEDGVIQAIIDFLERK